jgi:hypothetical protein
MSFLAGYMEAMLAVATDPEEIEMRRRVLDDHLAHQKASPADLDDIPIGAADAYDFDIQDGAGG